MLHERMAIPARMPDCHIPAGVVLEFHLCYNYRCTRGSCFSMMVVNLRTLRPGKKNMQQIIVQVKDKKKARKLFELLTQLDFVSSVKTSEAIDSEASTVTPKESLDFFSLAGLWEGREITLESIRQKAWPKLHP